MKADTKPRTPEQIRAARRRKQRLEDILTLAAAALLAVIFVIAVLGGIYLHFFAPCGQVDWMPTKDVPNRCFTADVR